MGRGLLAGDVLPGLSVTGINMQGSRSSDSCAVCFEIALILCHSRTGRLFHSLYPSGFSSILTPGASGVYHPRLPPMVRCMVIAVQPFCNKRGREAGWKVAIPGQVAHSTLFIHLVFPKPDSRCVRYPPSPATF